MEPAVEQNSKGSINASPAIKIGSGHQEERSWISWEESSWQKSRNIRFKGSDEGNQRKPSFDDHPPRKAKSCREEMT